MPHRKPQAPTELKILSYLSARMNLPSRDKKNLNNLEKGLKGELEFAALLAREHTGESISMYDLLLESNQTEFQIDNLLIYQDTIYMNEVKYFEGDFLINGDKWHVMPSKKEIRNPLLQLQRSEFLLRHILEQMGIHFNVQARLVFVHPEFSLYQAPYDPSLIFPTQLKRYIQDLNRVPNQLTNKHHNLAAELKRRHITTSRHERLPDYHFDQLKKGIVCGLCKGFMIHSRVAYLCCGKCGQEERTNSAVMRSVAEFHLLFPDKRITTAVIWDWCEVIGSKGSIRMILANNMDLIRNGKHSFYVFKK